MNVRVEVGVGADTTSVDDSGVQAMSPSLFSKRQPLPVAVHPAIAPLQSTIALPALMPLNVTVKIEPFGTLIGAAQATVMQSVPAPALMSGTQPAVLASAPRLAAQKPTFAESNVIPKV